MTDSVTVLMAADRHHRWLVPAVESVLSQTYGDIELLIADNSGGLVSQVVLDEFKDDRLAFVRVREGAGIGAVMRDGVQQARHELIAVLDSDDVMQDYRIALQVDYMRQHPDIAVLGSSVRLIDDDGVITGRRDVPTDHNEIIRLMWANPVIAPSVMFRRSRIVAVGNYSANLPRRADHDLWIRCALAGFRFHNLRSPATYYRIHAGGPTRGWRLARYQAQVGIMGAWRLKSPWYAYPLVMGAAGEKLLPGWAVKASDRLRRGIDPRRS